MKRKILAICIAIIVCAVFTAPTMARAMLTASGGGNATKAWVTAKSTVSDYITIEFAVYITFSGSEFWWNSASGSGTGVTVTLNKNDTYPSGYWYNVYFTATGKYECTSTYGSFSFYVS